MFNKGGGNINTDPNPVNTGTLRSRLEQIEAKNAAGRKETADLGAKVITLTAKIKGSVDPEEITTAADNATTDPNTAPDTAPTTNPDTAPNTSPDRQPTITETANTVKNKPVFRQMLNTTAGRAIVVALSLLILYGVYQTGRNSAKNSSNDIPQEIAGEIGEEEDVSNKSTDSTSPEESTSPDAHENLDEPKVQYDYSDWADIEHKSSPNAYGTSRADCYGDREKTATELIKTAEDLPEALASYKSIFFEDEQRELGIDGMSEKELEDYLSDTENPDAAKLQKKLLEGLTKIANDQDNTRFDFYEENRPENTFYIIWTDANEDGIQTPEEMHLGYSKAPRQGAPQTDIYRKNKDGNWVKLLDINLYCRCQPNLEGIPSEDLIYIPDEEATSLDEKTPLKPIVIPDNPTPEETTDDSKNQEAIVANMQTDPSVTSNTVTPSGSGAPTERPIVVESGSYTAEQNYNTTPKPTQVQQEADKTFAERQTLTPEQIAAAKAEANAAKDQVSADKAAQDIIANADLYSGMQGAEAAAWYEALKNGGQ